MEPIRGEFNDVLVVTELRGSYPNVPIAADVDYEALIAGDDKPMFLTLPIGKAGVTSGNKRHYDDAFVTELERQTLSSKPVGLMGHLSPAERATAFPPEAVHWVGVARDGDTLWGKGYIPPGPVRERIARYKAQGKAIATSIDAFAEGVWDETLKAFRMAANTLRLNQIDIAPADRAGIPALAAVPVLTTEMQADEQEQPQETVMDKYQVIQEMTVDDAKLLPDTVRQAIVATVPTPPEVAQVQELRAALGVDDKADLTKLVTELHEQWLEQSKAAIKSRITELATAGIKLDSVRGLVVELVEAKQPATAKDAEAVYQQVVEMEAVKAALAATVQNTMGPRQRTTVQPQNGTGQRRYFEIPQEAN
jgi:hypothetical protein